MNRLAREAVSAGGGTAELNGKLTLAAQAAATAQAKTLALKSEIGGAKTEMRTFAEATTMAKEAMGALGLTIGVGALVEFGKSVFEAAEQVYHEAEVLGMSTDAYQAYTESAKRAGVSAEVVDMALRKFNASIGEAQTGTGAQAKALNDLGIDAKHVSAESLPQVARALLSLGDNARSARDEVNLFSRSGEELRPALEEWAKGTPALIDEMKKLGLVMGEETVKGAHDASVAMTTAWERIEVQASPRIVRMTGLITKLLEFNEKISEWAESGWWGRSIFGGGDNTAAASGSHMVDVPVPKPRPEPGGPAPNYTDAADAKRAADEARRIANEIAEAYTQGALKRNQAEMQANEFLLNYGQRTGHEWLEQAFALEDERYRIAVAGMEKRKKADAGDKVALAKDLAEEAQLEREMQDRKDAVYEQFLQHKRELEQADLQAFIQNQQAQLQVGREALENQYRDHQITAQQLHDSELGLTHQVENEILKRLDAQIAGLKAGTAAYQEAMRERQSLEQQFGRSIQTTDNALTHYQAQKWQQLGNSIKSSFNGALGDVIFHGATLQAAMGSIVEGIASAFLDMGEQIIEEWLLQQIFGTASAGETAAAQIAAQAAVAGAAAVASTAAIPIIGPELAPAAGAAAYATAIAYEGLVALDVGTNFVPADMPAMIHRGERVMPAADNAAIMQLIKSGGDGGGNYQFGDIHIHGANTNDPRAFGRQIVSAIQREMRNGNLK